MKIVVAIFLFVLSLVLIGQNLDKPFWGEHDWNGVRYGNIARNYLRYGLLETKFGQVENSGTIRKEEFEYFTHYPPLLPLFISFSYKLFGMSEWSTRIVPLLFTSGSIALIFLIVTHLWDIKTGILSSLLIIFTPLILYFGKNPVHEPQVIFFVILAYFAYLKNLKLLFLVSLIMAHFSTWAGFFLVPAITLVEILKKSYAKAKSILPFWILSILIFLIHIVHTKILTGNYLGGDLLSIFGERIGFSEIGKIPELNPLSYVGKIRIWISTLYTNTLVILTIIWLISKRFSKMTTQDWAIVTLGIFGIAYFIFFYNAAFIHNYLTFYLLPFFALAGALGLRQLINFKFFKKISYVLIIIIIMFIALERRSFLKALNESSVDRFAVEVGKAINKNSKPNDLILVSPLKFSYSADKFLRFYSDRKIIYSDEEEDYDFKVKVDQDNGKFEIMRKR